MYVDYGYTDYENKDRELDEALAQTLGFSARDLRNNRKGRLSLKQRVVLMYKGVVPLLKLLIPFLGVLLMVGTVIVVGPWLSTKLRFLVNFSGTIFWFLGALIFGILALLANGVYLTRRLCLVALDLLFGSTAHADGRVTVSRAEEIEDGINQIMRARTVTCYFIQSGQSFEVSEEAYQELYNAGGIGHFRLHFTPYSRFLLSMEAPRSAQTPEEAGDRAA